MSSPRIAVLDVDGTLVDTNYQHALAWYRALRSLGETFPVWRIHRLIGMGGDQLVSALGGDDVEKRIGDAARERWVEEVDPMMGETALLPGARELIVALKERGHRVVLASSGKPHHVDRALDLLDARDLADAWTTSDDVEQTKPAPDLLQVALKKLGEPVDAPSVVIGDSVYDVEAAKNAGMPAIVVRSGGLRGRRTARRRRRRHPRHPGRPHRRVGRHQPALTLCSTAVKQGDGFAAQVPPPHSWPLPTGVGRG